MKVDKDVVISTAIYFGVLYFLCYVVWFLTAAKEPNWQENPEMTPEIPSIVEEVKDVDETTKPVHFNTENKLFLLQFEKIPNEVTQKFVERFLKTAVVEKWKYNIPISIKLAQGIVESACGTSQLAKRANNFFGMKCREKCKGCNGKKWEIVGNCINAHDDAKDDLFQMIESPWHSWRAHSILLTRPRYNHLRNLDPLEYKKWARGLKRAGYATEPKYAKILINYIERYKLYQYDRIDVHVLAKELDIDLSKIEKHK